MLKAERKGDVLTVHLSGELDHCAANALRKPLEERLSDKAIRRLHLDFSSVSFMDSSGVGFVIGRYKTMRALGGSVTVGGLTPEVDRLFHMGGLHRIIEITEGRDGK